MAKKFESGVKGYIVGKCIISVNFPIDWNDKETINCSLCKYYVPSARTCSLTKEVSEFPQKFVGSHCPLDFSGEVIM